MIALFTPAAVRIADVQAAVAAEFAVPVTELVSDRRSRSVAHARQVAFLLARELTPQSLAAIGRRFGDRDHSTVLHGIDAVRRRLDPRLLDRIAGARSRARRLAALRVAPLAGREPAQLALRLPDAAEPELAL